MSSRGTPRWQEVLRDRSTLDAIARAAKACMAEVCASHEPEDCDCPDNQMTPLEVADWIQRMVLLDRQRPTRIDHGDNRQEGQYRRRMGMSLAASA